MSKPLVSVETFLTHYPEMETFEEEVIEYTLKLAEAFHPANVWVQNGNNVKQIQGVMLRTAHMLEVKRLQIAKTAAAGASVSLGQSTSPSAVSGDNLDQTHYGSELKALIRTLPITGFAI